ncbi:M48 family metallopeptidase [Nocardioides sp. InS609-2]|uniref:M48 family metallopeptidase n=1 Tax=Nocardioides sp. InS609-2 TaxID=2760705 RepID=UPI0020BFC7E9|nr:M48 family metallopeptidase [Nocardioides sp. InS609-2]
MTDTTTPGDRRIAWWVTAVGGLAFVVLAALVVPWHPVPGGRVTPVDPGSVFTTLQLARADDFARWARIWSWGSLAVALVVAAALGFTRLGRSLMQRLPGPWWVRIVLGVAACDLIGRLVTLPFAIMLRRLQRANDLTRQSWGGYVIDTVKGEVLDIVVTSIALVMLIGLARRWRRVWPVVAAGLLAALIVLGSFVYPLLVEPVFNNFTSLPDGDLRTGIFELAGKEGVPVDDVLVADASRRTTTLNAYVSGFGGTRRVVLYDNLVDDLPRDEALSVVAHELAHARHRDVVVGTALGATGAVMGVGLLALVVGWSRRRSGHGSDGMADVAVVPLVLALMAFGTVLSAPVQNGISRQIETRADVDALRTTGERAPFVELQRQLALRSMADSTPPAWSQWWFGSHPGVLMRIAVADRLID